MGLDCNHRQTGCRSLLHAETQEACCCIHGPHHDGIEVIGLFVKEGFDRAMVVPVLVLRAVSIIRSIIPRFSA